MKKILFFALFMLNLSAVNAFTEAGYCEYKIPNQYDDTLFEEPILLISYDSKAEGVEYYFKTGETESDRVSSGGLVYGLANGLDKNFEIELGNDFYETLENNNLFSCPELTAAYYEDSIVIGSANTDGNITTKILDGKLTDLSDSGVEDDVYYETGSIFTKSGLIENLFIIFKQYESGKRSISFLQGTSEQTYELDYSDEIYYFKTTKTEIYFTITDSFIEQLFEDLIKNYKAGDAGKLTNEIYYHQTSGESTSNNITLSFDSDIDGSIGSATGDNDYYLETSNARLITLLSSLKRPLDMIDPLLEHDFITFNFSTLSGSNKICSASLVSENYCKETDEKFRYYIESGINDVIEYCDGVYSFYVNDNRYYPRVAECNEFIDFYEELYAKGYVRDLKADCAFISVELKEYIRGILNIIMIAAPILAVGLGVLDFVKVIASGDADKEMKKAFKSFLTRIGLAILLLIIPIILTFLMDLFLTNQPGYDPDSPFCGVIFDE